MALPQQDSYDVVIIGAGLSGLAAGIRLSQFFGKVLIVESHTIPGGLNSYYQRGKPRQLFSSGLHTVTNARMTSRKWGLGLIARNLGIAAEEFAIHPPIASSRITTPAASIRFSNDPGLLREEVRNHFPAAEDSFLRFEERMVDLSGDTQATGQRAMDFLLRQLPDPMLAELLALPVLTYAGYSEGDIDLRTYALLYRSIFLDGCGSPVDMKAFLKVLVDRYRENGGELCFRSPVEAILSEDNLVNGIRLRGGAEIRARFVLSSAGLHETGQLAGLELGEPGKVSLFQVAASYPDSLSSYGVGDAIHFVSRTERLQWAVSSEQDLYNILTFSAQDQYAFESGKHQFKASCFDRMDYWTSLSKPEYRVKKEERAARLRDIAGEYYPGLPDVQPDLVDSFSPLTIKRYTGHANGTLYGGEEKAFDGKTPIRNLLIIGNDQGGIGIMGAMTSGILVSNYGVITA